MIQEWKEKAAAAGAALAAQAEEEEEEQEEEEEEAESYGPWQEYWDESAQAKYWYNNETGEASWTIPEEFNNNSTSNNNTTSNVAASGGGGYGEWVSYIDETTGQEYWYNPTTGETSWG